MKRLLIFLSAVVLSTSAHATEVVSAYVVASCGTMTALGGNYPAGSFQPVIQDITGKICTSAVGGSGGTSAIDESAFTYGTTAYTPMGGVYNSSITNLTSGQGGAVALTPARSMHVLDDNSAAVLAAVTGAIPPGTNNIGTVNLGTGIANVTPTDCSGTITSGGTAQNAFSAQTALHGFTIVNIDTTEPLWISFTTTAAASGAGSYPLQAATATTFASPGSFTSPFGFGLNHALSVIAATTSHKFTCTWW